jgi:hypothetical protein
MREAEAIRELIRKRGEKGLPLERVPITWQLISLDEIKERRNKLNDALLESRMH